MLVVNSLRMKHAFGALILLIMGVFFISLRSLNYSVDLPQEKNIDYIKEAKTRSEVKNAAVAFLALGAQANQMNCPAAVESLVRYGGWSGHVYLITDRTDCFDHDTIVKNADMESSKFHLRKVHERFSGGFDIFGKLGSRVMRMKSLSMKSKVFDFIEDEQIDTVVFADCDILFGQPQCVEEMVRDNSDWSNHSIRFSHVSHEENGRLSNLHSGAFMAHRTISKEAMQKWGEQFLYGIHEHDRDAYRAAYEDKQIEVEKNEKLQHAETKTLNEEEMKILLPPLNTSSNHIHWNKNPLNPTDLPKSTRLFPSDEWYEKFYNAEEGSPVYCMNHISKARCSDLGRDQVQSFVDRFRLKTYEGKYHYCTHEQVAPLQYGWFPFDMVPFCPKLEKIM